MEYRDSETLKAGMGEILSAPVDCGRVEMIVRRPESGEREVLEIGRLDLEAGLVGDNWLSRGSKHTVDGRAHPEMQLTLMNSRVIELVAGSRERWPLAGDQLFVDFDLSDENIPAGTQLCIGSAVVEITSMPHRGCKKFTKRFGIDAVRFVNASGGRALNLRGVNAKVVQGGKVRVSDTIKKG